MLTEKQIDAHLTNFVTVETEDDVFVGTLNYGEFEDEAGMLVVYSGLRGRPHRIDPEDVVEILPATTGNPHLEVAALKRRVVK